MRKVLVLAIAALSVLMLAAGVLVIPPTEQTETELAVAFSAFALAFVAVGALVAVSRPDNAVGWLMLSAGATMSIPVVSGQYAGWVLFGDGGGALGAARLSAWLSTWLYILAAGALVCLLLAFPAGRLLGRRRWLAAVAAPATATASVAQALVPGEMDGFPGVANPFGIVSAQAVLDAVLTVSGTVVAVAFLIAVAAVFARLRSADGDERQQLKWFAYAAALFVLGLVLNGLPLGLDSSFVGLAAVVLSLLAMPLAIGVAVLKYRLYDIDVVINRTLVYLGLTASLGAAYLVLVLLVGLAVGKSDLAVAALFGPARARIQALVDRRFYRRRYDATRTLEAFGARLRDELDLEMLGADLRDVVREAVQPAHVSLWLRGER